ncbi:hypothetical protein BDV18DRAFT_162376 [Aspergillus unguis]
MDRPRSRPLSPVPEEEVKDEESENGNEGKGEGNENGNGKATAIADKVDTDRGPELASEPESASDDDADSQPLEIEVHGLKAKVYLNCADVDMIPVRYLEKAGRMPILKRTPWIFRAVKDGRDVNMNKWSKVDIRFRGVFKTLKKVPAFKYGLFDGPASEAALTSENGRKRSGSGSGSAWKKIDFEEAVKAQGQVVYALLDEVLNMLKIRREAEDNRECFFLIPRLISVQPEYWTGYRVKHHDTPTTAGSVSLDYEPYRGTPRAVIPVSATSERHQSIKETLTGEFKLLLAQLLVNVHTLRPPGDKFPDQEAFLISLHGSRLHILRGIFPGQKTSRLWCGRHNPSTSDVEAQSTHSLVTKTDRFYTKMNLEKIMEQVEWNQLSNPANEVHPRSFQILSSREYDLWMKWEFAAAIKMLSGLFMYLMSGQARCGVLQEVFEMYPYDEGLEPDSEDEYDDATEKVAKEQREIEEEEKRLKESEKKKRNEEKEKIQEREAMRSSVKDRIGGLAEGFRQPWWDWVWEDKSKEGIAKDDDEIILGSP